MKKIILIGHICLLTLLFPNKVENNILFTSRIKLFENWIETQINNLNLEGISLAIIHDQKILYSNSFGLINKKNEIKANTNSIFKIASITKLFTSIGILKLVEEGKIDLNDPVVKYIPEIKNIQSSNYNINNIKIKNLLTHTAGFPMNSDYYWDELNIENPTTFSTTLDRLKNQNIINKPNRRYKYSNLGMTIAGIIIERVSKIEYSLYIEKNIFDVLNMTNSTFHYNIENNENFAVGYSNIINQNRTQHPFTDLAGQIDSPGSGALSSVDDLAKFIKWHFRVLDHKDNLIISEESLRDMQKLKWVGLPFNVNPILMQTLSFLLQNFYNYGTGLGYSNQGNFVGHAGGHYGFSSELVMDNKNKIGIVVLSNTSDTPTHINQNKSISKNLYEIIAKLIIDDNLNDPPIFIDYSNSFSDGFFRNVHISAIEDYLILFDLNSAFPMNNPIVYKNIGIDKFIASPDIGWDHGESEIIFDRNSVGEIVSLSGVSYRLYIK